MDGKDSDSLKQRSQVVADLRRAKGLAQQLQLQLKALNATSSIDQCRRLTAEIVDLSDRSINMIAATDAAPIPLSDVGSDELQQPFCGSPKKPMAKMSWPSEQLDTSSDVEPFQDYPKKPKAEVPWLSLRPPPPTPPTDAGSDEKKPFQDDSPKKPKAEAPWLSTQLELAPIPISDAGSDEKKPFHDCPKKPKAGLRPWHSQHLALAIPPRHLIPLSNAGSDEKPFQDDSLKKPKAEAPWLSPQLELAPIPISDAGSDEKKPVQDCPKKPKEGVRVPWHSQHLALVIPPRQLIPLSNAGSEEKPFQDDSLKKPKAEAPWQSPQLELAPIPISDAGSDEKRPVQDCPKKPKAEVPWHSQHLAAPPPRPIPLSHAGSDEKPFQGSPKKPKAMPWWFSQHSSTITLVQKSAEVGDKSSNSSSMSINQETVERVEDKGDDISRIEDDEVAGIVRRPREKHDIMELVMSQEPCNKRVTIICITGGHGIGKTDLASVVYWDDTTFRYFEAKAWLCFSDACDYEEILRSVIASLTGVPCWLSELDELEEILGEEVTGKKVLLVLDNLSENNVGVCRQLLSLLSVSDKGSAVMVTVNDSFIAVELGATHIYDLKALSFESFLILAKPISIEYSPLRNIISKMPSRCSGYPMFAKAVRGILYSALARNCGVDDTDRMLTEIFRKPDNHLHNLLYLSYTFLLPHQKMCLLYCSMFPRDYTHNKERLFRLWMSQGVIVPEKEKNEQGHCEDDFDELLHGPFFTYSPLSKVMEQKYVMHELPPDFARHASGNTFFRAHDHELHCIPKDVQHLSIIPQKCDLDIHFSFVKQIRDLRTFLLLYNSHLESGQFHIMDVKALDEYFRNLSCLNTLDLSHTDIKELPESIGYITSLRFLGLNNTNIRKLPDSVCNLINLQTLELQNSAFLVNLPSDIKNLNSLYHLDASKEHGLIYVPPGIGEMTNLRTLTTFTVGGVSWNCKVYELERLNNLKGFLHIQSLNNVENAEDAKRACLAAKKLRKLSLEWCHDGEDISESSNCESDTRICVAKDVIDALKPHNLLGELSITGYYGQSFPSWIDHSLTDLVCITLENCYNCLRLPPLGTLPALRFLFLQNLRGVQLISFEFCGFEFPTTGSINHKRFPKLETLKLRDMYNLEYWSDDVLEADYPSLLSLSFERCPKLKSIPRFQHISDISVMSCSKLSLPGLQSLQSLKLGNLRQRVCFALPFELCSLVMLEVASCEHLSSVEGLSQLQSLKHLKFRTCPQLTFIQDEPLPVTLETVDIHTNCYALRKWRPKGFEEMPDASEVYRKFIRRKCEAKGVDDAVMHDSMSH